MGLALRAEDVEKVPLGQSEKSWVLRSDGTTCHNGETYTKLEEVAFEEGDVIVCGCTIWSAIRIAIAVYYHLCNGVQSAFLLQLFIINTMERNPHCYCILFFIYTMECNPRCYCILFIIYTMSAIRVSLALYLSFIQ